MRILVIGATGNIGREVISLLPSTGSEVRAMVRNRPLLHLPSHVQVLQGDLTAPQTLDACLDGVDSVFLVWSAPHTAVPAAIDVIARRARRIVFLSSPWKTLHPMFQMPQPNPVSALHRQIEQLIEASGLEWTFLRPGMFALNARLWWGPQIRAGDIVRWPYRAACTAPVHERDIAAVAVRALREDGHAGAEYVLTGPEALTHEQQVQTIGRAIGRSLRYEEISPEQARREWSGAAPPPVVEMLLAAWAGATRFPPFVTSTAEDVTGARPRSFQEWTLDHAADFQP
jgi:uncharacterized protein YbjT (DUF2867 family)